MFRTPYSAGFIPGSVPSRSSAKEDVLDDPSIPIKCAVQTAKEECDINNILSRNRLNPMQLVTHPDYVARSAAASYGDAICQDYHTALVYVNTIRQEFASLPSRERARYNNDPAVWAEQVAMEPYSEFIASYAPPATPTPHTNPADAPQSAPSHD